MTKDPKIFPIMVILTVFFSMSYILICDSPSLISLGNTNTNERLGELKSSATYFDIVIDDSSVNNWTWAKSQGYCTGSGIISDPYILENHVFLFDNKVSLTIVNSEKYFVIRDSVFMGSNNGTGLYLKNVTNGWIQECTFSNLHQSMILENCNRSTLTMLGFEFSYNGIELKKCVNNTFYLITFYKIFQKAFNLKDSDYNNLSTIDIQQSEDGLFLENCNYNSINHMTIHLNTGTGIQLNMSNYNKITETTINENYDGIIITNSNYNQFLICSSSFNEGIGLGIAFSEQNIIRESNFYNNSITGIDLYSCNNNTIEKNKVNLNYMEGIRLSSSTLNMISDNEITNNGLEGISLSSCSYNHISDNRIIISQQGVDPQIYLGNGISLILSDLNKISENSISVIENGDGIFLLISSSNEIINNEIWANPDPDINPLIYNLDGISIVYGDYNNIIKNEISDFHNGIFSNNSDNNLLASNRISFSYQSSVKNGIYLENSNHNFVIENVIINSNPLENHCIIEKNCQDNVFISNQCSQEFDLIPILFIGTIIPSLALNLVLLLLFLRKRKRIKLTRGD